MRAYLFVLEKHINTDRELIRKNKHKYDFNKFNKPPKSIKIEVKIFKPAEENCIQ